MTPLADGLLAGKDAAAFTVHSTQPLQAELRRDAQVAEPITPLSRWYVRNHRRPPATMGAVGWVIQVDGVVEPSTIDLEMLAELPQIETTAALQCAGNGRAWHPGPPAGAGWLTGAAACARWSGVRVADVAAALGGVADGAKFLTTLGGDASPDDPGRVERSIPLPKALDDTVLAVAMNGAPLLPAHGAPIRLIVPGYYAVNAVKYVRRLAFTASESDAVIMVSDYRRCPPGHIPSPAQPTCWSMAVTSWLTSATPTVGGVVAEGLAIGGESAVAGVEVTADGGHTWTRAALGPDLGYAAWRCFSATLDLGTGTHRLASRAQASDGSCQPVTSSPDLRGYAGNGWREPTVTCSVVDGARLTPTSR